MSAPMLVAPKPIRPMTDVSDAVYSFRLLEALRSGDPAAIAPFLKEKTGGPVRELTSPLHLAIRCAESTTIQMILQQDKTHLNQAESQNGNTALHLASMIGRADVVQYLLSLPGIDDTIRNAEGLDAMEVSKTPEIAQIFQVSRAEINFAYQDLLEKWEKDVPGSTDELKAFLDQDRIDIVDLNAASRSGSTVLHEAVRRKDTSLIELAVRKGADVFGRNRKGKRAIETTKDEKIKALLQQLSNADAARAANSSMPGLPPTFRGYLGKWTNFAGGYKTRWFVLEHGILSYYRTQEEEGKQSRGSTNLRFAKIRADGNDKHRFEVIADGASKSSNRLYLRGGHPVERARWVQVLQQSVDFFEIERTPSRAESIRSLTLSKSAGSEGGLPVMSSNMPAGSATPLSVPSRTSTPFRSIPTAPAPTLLSSSATSTKQPSFISGRTSDVSRPGLGKSPSILTKGSRTPSDDAAEGHLDGGRPGDMPFEEQLPLLSTYMRTQMDLSQQLANAASASPSSSEAISALQGALQAMSSLLVKYQDAVSQRESYLLRRYEQEIQAKHLWEENIRTLAQQHADMEAQLQEAAQDNAKKRKALREMRETIGSSPSNTFSPGMLASPGVVPGRAGSSVGTERAPLPVGLVGTAATIGASSALPTTNQAKRGNALPTLNAAAMKLQDSDVVPSSALMDAESAEDVDDEFFDAIESGNLPNLKIEDPVETPSAEANTNGATIGGAEASKDKLSALGVEPYLNLRSVMAIGKDDRPSVSLWSILKNNIGKDLTKISFPVSLNEPTSMLQRMAEDMTYAYLLDTAVRQKDSTLRMAFVAAFACSNYVTTQGRVAKPFNPMLGETFEFINLQGSKYRYQSEQVSHHPPISACISESLKDDGVTPSGAWEYTGCVSAQSKFLGRSFEVRPTGWAHVKLLVDGVVEHYSFKKVTTSISGFVTGSPTIDHYGDMNLRCHTTGDECTMTFKPRGWRSSAAHELKGSVRSGKDNSLAWEIAGRWSSQIVARRVTTADGDNNLDPDGNVDSLSSDPSTKAALAPAEMVLLWKYHEQPLEAFNLTPYAVLLNDLPDGLHDWLPPTDCRLRPDLRLFETGRYDEADVMKRNLEELQRATRKKREAGQVAAHKPKFFTRIIDNDTQADYWQPHRMSASAATTPEYWVRRKSRQWDGVEKIFGDYTA